MYIAAPNSTKNQEGKRDPEMHQTKKGNEWHFGMKAHAGVDAGSGYVHTITGTSANVRDISETLKLLRGDGQVVYGDSGYLDAPARPEIKDDEVLSKIEFRIFRIEIPSKGRGMQQFIMYLITNNQILETSFS